MSLKMRVSASIDDYIPETHKKSDIIFRTVEFDRAIHGSNNQYYLVLLNNTGNFKKTGRF